MPDQEPTPAAAPSRRAVIASVAALVAGALAKPSPASADDVSIPPSPLLAGAVNKTTEPTGIHHSGGDVAFEAISPGGVGVSGSPIDIVLTDIMTITTIAAGVVGFAAEPATGVIGALGSPERVGRFLATNLNITVPVVSGGVVAYSGAPASAAVWAVNDAGGVAADVVGPIRYSGIGDFEVRRGEQLIVVDAPSVEATDFVTAVLNTSAGRNNPVDFVEVRDRGFVIGLGHVAVNDARGTWLHMKRH